MFRVRDKEDAINLPRFQTNKGRVEDRLNHL